MKKKTVVILSVILPIIIVLALVIGSAINNAGKITKISLKEKNADTAELSINYSFGVGGYSVYAVSAPQGEYTGDGKVDYDGSLGEYRILIEFGDISLSNDLKNKIDKNGKIDGIPARVAYPSDNGVVLYLGFDKPISIEAQKGVQLNSLGGTIKITIAFKNNSVEQIYNDFLNGEIPALDNGTPKHLNEYFEFEVDKELYTYTFLDVTNDGVAELCVRQSFYTCFFTVKDGGIYHYYTEDMTYYCRLLNNGAILYERHGGAPTHINYEYYTIDENAERKVIATFSWWDGKSVEVGKIYPDTYIFNDKEVSKEEYEAKTKEYLSVGSDKIVWYDKDGNVVRK